MNGDMSVNQRPIERPHLCAWDFALCHLSQPPGRLLLLRCGGVEEGEEPRGPQVTRPSPRRPQLLGRDV